MTRKTIFAVLVLVSSFFLVAFRADVDPATNLLGSILEKLKDYYEWYPQQKAYLHTDKSSYNVDERIWYKAYVVDATDHHPDQMSTNLYVDLINPTGYVVQTRLLRLTDGLAKGDFPLQDTVPEGRYKIRAYTNWMRNAGEDFLFSKDIYINNPQFTTYADKLEVKDMRKAQRLTSRKADKYDISFHPEGGSLLSGVENQVGYKSLNELGIGIDFEGYLSDRKGNKLFDVVSEHMGMGSFTFIPETGEKYFLHAIFPDGKEQKYRLPESVDMGVNIHVEPLFGDSIQVYLLSNLDTEDFPANTNYHLLAHTRGNPVYNAEMDLRDKLKVSVAKDLFPSGIAHFTLFNSASNPVSERLVFLYNDPALDMQIENNTSSAGKREKINSAVLVKDSEGNPVSGNFSLSVVKNSRLTNDKNILSELLLSSDLKGNIEKPGYYFENYNSIKAKHLDNLMLTQGWRRFQWSVVIVNEKMPVEYPLEEGIVIDGRITRELFNLPLSDIRVTLTILNQFNDIYTTRSGPEGYFSFENLNYPDTVGIKLEAVRNNGKRNLVIRTDTKDPGHLENMVYLTEDYIRKPGEKGKLEPMTDPEEIERQNDPFYEENNSYNRIHQEPNDVIIVDESMQNYSNVAQIIQGRVPGVMVSGDKIIIRGTNTFTGNTDPLFIVDGVAVEKSYALNLSPYNIDRIEVLKGPDAAVYGSRGANGVIVIFTKKGKFILKGVLSFDILGYYTPSEFYSPKYEIQNRDESFEDDRTTLFWDPDLKTDSDGRANFEFYTSDLDGEYSIIVEGLDENGKPGVARTIFNVE